ncbi:Nucleoside triphosphatase NudI [archaeon HR01]|nr:Nucleoside triphosphatase NudI [archaeon HR01]
MSRTPEITVGSFIRADDGEILLVKSPKWFGKYSIPGGHVELGESVLEAAAREAYEEVGLRVRPVRVIMVQEVYNPENFFEPGRHFIFFDVLCRSSSKIVKVDNKEIVDFVWCRPRDALRLELEKYTRLLLRGYLKYRGGRPLWASNISGMMRRL